ncbi:FtsX-like permease family protein [Uniformispora flossi]|uniref:FtsX-like permease family protein n=1 Tax=Uniformispora flossi TaxID=3390723 RepID=UPI003C2FD8B1
MRATAIPGLAYAGIRARPVTFAGLAAAVFLTVASVTLFGTLVVTPAPAAPDGRAGLALLGGAFGEIAVIAAVFVVAATLGYAVRQQQRELVLLRAVGATPRQVRRIVRAQADVPLGAARVRARPWRGHVGWPDVDSGLHPRPARQGGHASAVALRRDRRGGGR